MNIGTQASRSLLLLPMSVVACMIAIIIPLTLSWPWAISLIALCALLTYSLRSYKYVSELFLILAFMCCGFLIERQSQEDQVFLCEVSGFVERIYPNDYNQRIRLRVHDIQLPVVRPENFRKISCELPLSPVLRVGDYIELRGLCRGEQREYYYRWLLKAQSAEVIDYREDGSRAVFWKLINNLDRDQSVATALVLGIPSYHDQQQFRAAGIAHMLAVSGLHVGIIFMLCALVLRFFSVPWYMRHIALMGVVIFYLWLTGMAIPTQRAAIMAVLIGLSQILGRHVRCYATLSLAALIIVCIHPHDVLSAGFQLSFVAVAGILHSGLALRGLRMHYFSLMPWPLDRPLWRCGLWSARAICDALCIGIAASLAVTPLLVWHFQVLNPWSPLATVLVTPLVAIIIAAACIYSALEFLWTNGPWDIFVLLTQYALDALSWVRELIAQWPGSQLHVEGNHWYVFLLWPLMFMMSYLSDRRLRAVSQKQQEDKLTKTESDTTELPVF